MEDNIEHIYSYIWIWYKYEMQKHLFKESSGVEIVSKKIEKRYHVNLTNYSARYILLF